MLHITLPERPNMGPQELCLIKRSIHLAYLIYAISIVDEIGLNVRKDTILILTDNVWQKV